MPWVGVGKMLRNALIINDVVRSEQVGWVERSETHQLRGIVMGFAIALPILRVGLAKWVTLYRPARF